MARHLGRFELSIALLPELFHLPESTTVLTVTGDAYEQMVLRKLTATVEDPALPEVEEGQEVPEILPVWERDEEGNVTLIDWGINPDKGSSRFEIDEQGKIRVRDREE